jgi:hypothetical protein
MTTLTGVWSVVIAAVVTLLVFLGTQLWVGGREKSKRTWDRDRTTERDARRRVGAA